MALKISKVLKFLQEPKTRKELERKYNLSNNESYHLVKWLLKAKEIEEIKVHKSDTDKIQELNINVKILKQPNHIWLYKTIQQ